MTFAERSRYLRKEKGLSQVELAKALNVSKACISMIEIGKNEPTAITLIKYADFFKCSIDYLLNRADDLGVISIQNQSAELTPDGKELLDIFNALEKEYQAQILEYARYFAQRRGIKIKKA